MDIKGVLLLHESGNKYIDPEDEFFNKGILILKNGNLSNEFLNLNKGFYVVHDMYDKGVLTPSIGRIIKNMDGYKIHIGKYDCGDKACILEVI